MNAPTNEQEKIAYLKATQATQKPVACVYFAPLSAEEKRQREEDIKAGRLPF